MRDYDPFIDCLLYACKWALIGIAVGALMCTVFTFFAAHPSVEFS